MWRKKKAVVFGSKKFEIQLYVTFMLTVYEIK